MIVVVYVMNLRAEIIRLWVFLLTVNKSNICGKIKTP